MVDETQEQRFLFKDQLLVLARNYRKAKAQQAAINEAVKDLRDEIIAEMKTNKIITGVAPISDDEEFFLNLEDNLKSKTVKRK